ncbi:methylglutaconyl-CoA hydratase [Amycolatopsis bartoniae]|uniref:Enoyl-CoA hydratase n=1 Tax=Amycolatopsis bartoniae TaxID=941986 RepID=A0A8H9IXI9_9PSEU|nr:enoyl-CoA hydratase family protein [Amycolatopsis bartoniae]MBB2935759.1 methylglutaconyl-CoA hydratase [Amycolatopsis bartoniae]TVT05866.1 enoyl-CoA hydratase family protein [Amycolatopsis bartoniae]GHF61689.1 enoyl-CoA hydratase [Amycolatopsis bartoniae]
MADELVHYSVRSGAATITLDSPHNRNALSAQLRRELRAALAKAGGDTDVRVIVLTHTGPVFCAGMDLKEARGADASDQGVNEFPEILQQIWSSPKPVVAKLAGPARAGGVGMVAAADIVVAAKEATFAFSEVRIGVVPAVISLVVLPRIAPRAAQELMLTGEVFDAARAAEIGLITAAVDAEKLDDETDRYVRALTLGGPNALAATKELLASPRPPTPSAGFQAMNALSARFFASEEGQEGIVAFAQKRKPNWVPAD